MKPFTFGHALVAALLLSTLSACSSVPTQDALTRFADASTKAESALVGLDQWAASYLTEQRKAALIKNPAALSSRSEDCGDDSKRCRLLFKASVNDSDPQPLKVSSLIPNQLAVMREVTRYAQNLKAIEQADASEEVNAAAQSAAGSIQSLAGLLGPQASAAAVLAGPLADAASMAFESYQEHEKRDALTDAITAMDPVLQAASSKYFGPTADWAGLARQTIAVEAFRIARQEFRTNPNASTYATLVASAEGLDAMAVADPAGVFAALSDAHAELRKALNSDEIVLSEALKKISVFAEKAENAFQIAEEIKESVETLQ